jgi:hypothetical protein
MIKGIYETMTTLSKKIIFLAFAAILLTIPLTVSLVQRQQEIRTQATASTTLAILPQPPASSPLQEKVGDTFTLDLMLNPDTNLVTMLTLQINYDPTKLELVNSPTPLTINADAFPQTLEGPVINPGMLSAIYSVGDDPSKAIQQSTKVGTITFRAIAPTGDEPTTVSLGSTTQVKALGSNDNVLSTSTPTTIVIR